MNNATISEKFSFYNCEKKRREGNKKYISDQYVLSDSTIPNLYHAAPMSGSTNILTPSLML